MLIFVVVAAVIFSVVAQEKAVPLLSKTNDVSMIADLATPRHVDDSGPDWDYKAWPVASRVRHCAAR